MSFDLINATGAFKLVHIHLACLKLSIDSPLGGG